MAIESRLYKASLLALRSAYFPTLVQAACALNGKDYGPRVLVAAAAAPAILNNLTLPDSGQVDVVLLSVMEDPVKAAALDAVIENAVVDYTGPIS